MHDGMLDPIGVLEMLCTLNLTKFPPVMLHKLAPLNYSNWPGDTWQ